MSINPQPIPAQPVQPTALQPIPPDPPFNPKPKKKKWTLIWVVLIFTAGIVLGLLLQNIPLLSTIYVPGFTLPLTPTPAIELSPSPTFNPTADWKTYTNSKYTFKYPTNWTLNDFTGGQQVETYYQPDKTKSVGAILVEISTRTPGNISQYSIKKQIGNQATDCMIDSSGFKTWCYLSNPMLSFLITKDQSTTYNEILDTILSTFKFTDQNSAIHLSPTQTHSNSILLGYNSQIMENLQNGQSIKKMNNPSLTLPTNINAAQITNYFQLGNIYFALVMQPSMNVVLNTPENYHPTFVGVLISKQGESQWIKFTEIKDKQSDNKNNPYYLWTNSKNLLLSVVDQNGAGSGEGMMKLFTWSTNGNWGLTQCYYFGGAYNGPSVNGDYYSYSSKLSEQIPKSLTECNNVIITP